MDNYNNESLVTEEIDEPLVTRHTKSYNLSPMAADRSIRGPTKSKGDLPHFLDPNGADQDDLDNDDVHSI